MEEINHKEEHSSGDASIANEKEEDEREEQHHNLSEPVPLLRVRRAHAARAFLERKEEIAKRKNVKASKDKQQRRDNSRKDAGRGGEEEEGEKKGGLGQRQWRTRKDLLEPSAYKEIALLAPGFSYPHSQSLYNHLLPRRVPPRTPQHLDASQPDVDWERLPKKSHGGRNGEGSTTTIVRSHQTKNKRHGGTLFPLSPPSNRSSSPPASPITSHVTPRLSPSQQHDDETEDEPHRKDPTAAAASGGLFSTMNGEVLVGSTSTGLIDGISGFYDAQPEAIEGLQEEEEEEEEEGQGEAADAEDGNSSSNHVIVENSVQMAVEVRRNKEEEEQQEAEAQSRIPERLEGGEKKAILKGSSAGAGKEQKRKKVLKDLGPLPLHGHIHVCLPGGMKEHVDYCHEEDEHERQYEIWALLDEQSNDEDHASERPRVMLELETGGDDDESPSTSRRRSRRRDFLLVTDIVDRSPCHQNNDRSSRSHPSKQAPSCSQREREGGQRGGDEAGGRQAAAVSSAAAGVDVHQYERKGVVEEEQKDNSRLTQSLEPLTSGFAQLARDLRQIEDQAEGLEDEMEKSKQQIERVQREAALQIESLLQYSLTKRRESRNLIRQSLEHWHIGSTTSKTTAASNSKKVQQQQQQHRDKVDGGAPPTMTSSTRRRLYQEEEEIIIDMKAGNTDNNSYTGGGNGGADGLTKAEQELAEAKAIMQEVEDEVGRLLSTQATTRTSAAAGRHGHPTAAAAVGASIVEGPSSVRSHFSASSSRSPSPSRYQLPPRRSSATARPPPPFATVTRNPISTSLPPSSINRPRSSIDAPGSSSKSPFRRTSYYQQPPSSVPSQLTVPSLGSTAMSAFRGRRKRGSGGILRAGATGYYRQVPAANDRPRWML